jgi:hypothetical protein
MSKLRKWIRIGVVLGKSLANSSLEFRIFSSLWSFGHWDWHYSFASFEHGVESSFLAYSSSMFSRPCSLAMTFIAAVHMEFGLFLFLLDTQG